MSRNRASGARRSGDPRKADEARNAEQQDTRSAAAGPMSGRRAKDVRRWLATKPELEELQEAFPGDWLAVQRDMTEVVSRGAAEVKAYVRAVARGTVTTPDRRGPADSVSEEVRRQMVAAALKRMSFSIATGVEEGRVRFNLVNGWIAQRLLFARGLERKPASMFWFRLWWPLLWQRRRLIPLVSPKASTAFTRGS